MSRKRSGRDKAARKGTQARGIVVELAHELHERIARVRGLSPNRSVAIHRTRALDHDIATGATLAEVEELMREGIRLHIEAMHEDGEPIPEPTAVGAALVSV